MTRRINLKLEWQSIVLYAANVATELCWLWPVMLLINGAWAGGRLNLPGTASIYLLSLAINKVLQRRGWRKIFLTSINWVLWAAAMLIAAKLQLFSHVAWMDASWLVAIPAAVPRLIYGIEPQIILLILSLIMWWLGKWIAGRGADFKTSMAEFQFGLLILLIAYLISTAIQFEIPRAAAVTVFFFLFSLAGIALAHHLEGSAGLQRIGEGKLYSLMLGSIVLVLIVGLAITIIMTPDLLRLVAAALAWLGSLLMNLLAWLASLIPDSGPAEAIPPMASMPPGEPEAEQFWKIPENVRAWMQIGWGIIWITLFALALWRISTQIYRWFSRRTRSNPVNQPMKGAFKEDIISIFKRLWRRVRLFLSVWLSRGRKVPEMEASIYQIYQNFLKWGAKRGYPRKAAQTPHEYMTGLAAIIPVVWEDISGITHNYVRIRYGAEAPTAAEVSSMSQRWNRIRQYRPRKNNRKITSGGL